jgi:hypothetical protein
VDFGNKTQGGGTALSTDQGDVFGDIVAGHLVGIRERDIDRKEPDRKTGELTFKVWTIVLDCEEHGSRYVDCWTLAEAKRAVGKDTKKGDRVMLPVAIQVRAGRCYYKWSGGDRELSEEAGWVPLD